MTSPSLSNEALHDQTVQQLASALKSRTVSAVEVAQHFLQRGRDHAALGTYVDVNEDATLAQARAASRYSSWRPCLSAATRDGLSLARRDRRRSAIGVCA